LLLWSLIFQETWTVIWKYNLRCKVAIAFAGPLHSDLLKIYIWRFSFVMLDNCMCKCSNHISNQQVLEIPKPLM
jgi:hypothetical protein